MAHKGHKHFVIRKKVVKSGLEAIRAFCAVFDSISNGVKTVVSTIEDQLIKLGFFCSSHYFRGQLIRLRSIGQQTN